MLVGGSGNETKLVGGLEKFSSPWQLGRNWVGTWALG